MGSSSPNPDAVALAGGGGKSSPLSRRKRRVSISMVRASSVSPGRQGRASVKGRPDLCFGTTMSCLRRALVKLSAAKIYNGATKWPVPMSWYRPQIQRGWSPSRARRKARNSSRWASPAPISRHGPYDAQLLLPVFPIGTPQSCGAFPTLASHTIAES